MKIVIFKQLNQHKKKSIHNSILLLYDQYIVNFLLFYA